MPPSCALLGRFAIGARVALVWQHNANAKCQRVHACTRPSYISRESYTTRNVLWSPTSVCVSVRSCTPTLLHEPGCNLRSGRGCPLVVHYWTDLQSVRGLRCYVNTRNAWQSPAVIRQAHRTLHALHMHAPAIESTCLLRARRCLQRGHSISSILWGVII